MKKLIGLLCILLLIGCEKEELVSIDIDDIIVDDNTTNPITQTIYKESYLNQKSGIVFLWGGPAGGGGVPTYITNMGINTQGPQ